MYYQLLYVVLFAFLLSTVTVATDKITPEKSTESNTSQSQHLATFANSIGMEFVLIPAGKFMMGANPNDQNANDDENPRHEVAITNPFYMGKHEVTQGQWTKIMGDNPSNFDDDLVGQDFLKHPVESIDWKDVKEFIKRLNMLEKTDKYRLPTEAEWEYAARAGTQTLYYWGNDEISLGNYAWYNDNSDEQTHPVGKKKPNTFGLYDIAGNVWEWTCSIYTEKYNGNELKCDLTDEGKRVLRGGSWLNESDWMRSSVRYSFISTFGSHYRGFRVVAVIR